MGQVKHVNIKNQTYYFYNDIIDLKNFEPNLLKIDKNQELIFTTLDTSRLKNDEYESIYSLNPLFLCISHASGYNEEKNGKKILNFWFCWSKQRSIKKYADIWDGIKNKIKAINSGKENDYEKDCMKFKFSSDDELPLNKLLKFHLMTIIIRSVFEEDGKFYPQLFLHDTLYEL